MVRLRHAAPLVYRIDAGDRISYLDPEWSAEHPAGAWPRLEPGNLLGRPLWDSLGDATVRELYRAIIARVRAGRAFKFCYRCDTPDRGRLYGMKIRLCPENEVEFASTLQREQARPAIALLDPAPARDDRHVVAMCSWCQRIALPVDYWVPIEEAMLLGGFMEADPLPRLEAGVCPPCQRRLSRQLRA